MFLFLFSSIMLRFGSSFPKIPIHKYTTTNEISNICNNETDFLDEFVKKTGLEFLKKMGNIPV